MPVPKKRLSSTRSGNRRSHLTLRSPVVAVCSNCRAIVAPHTVCLKCGFYRGKRVLSEKVTKK